MSLLVDIWLKHAEAVAQKDSEGVILQKDASYRPLLLECKVFVRCI